MAKACPDAYAIVAKMEDVGMVMVAMVAMRLLVPAEDPWSEEETRRGGGVGLEQQRH